MSDESEQPDTSEAEDSSQGGDSSDEDDSDRPPSPKVELPFRDTRGKRMGRLMEDEGSADEEFWQQEFFAEERKDDAYEESTEEEDVPDEDFSEAESDESEGDADKDADERQPKKPKLKPPGAPGAPKRKPPAGPSQSKPAKRPRPVSAPGTDYVPDAPTLRQSTKQRTEDAELMRLYSEQVKPQRKKTSQPEVRQLTQRQLLAEAAVTEIQNTKSLQVLEAIEEDLKRRSAVKTAKYVGPLVRMRSRQVDGAALTTLEVMNMLVPPELQPVYAPEPPVKPTCVVTGLPARYRDPATGLPYHDLAAFRVLKAHYGRR